MVKYKPNDDEKDENEDFEEDDPNDMDEIEGEEFAVDEEEEGFIDGEPIDVVGEEIFDDEEEDETEGDEDFEEDDEEGDEEEEPELMETDAVLGGYLKEAMDVWDDLFSERPRPSVLAQLEPTYIKRKGHKRQRGYNFTVHPIVVDAIFKLSIMVNNLWEKMYQKTALDLDVALGNLVEAEAGGVEGIDPTKVFNGLTPEEKGKLMEFMNMVRKGRENNETDVQQDNRE